MPRLRSSFARAVALLLCWQIGRLAPSFVPEVTQDNTLALGRRSALVGALSLTQPGMAWAKRGASEEGEMATKQAMPTEIETEEPINEEWKPVDIGESTLVDPDDPKYKNMRLMNEIEKQKQRNEEYNAMSPEAVQKFFWAEMKHRLVKKTRHLALATRTLVQAHGTTTSPKANSLGTKFDKRIANKIQRYESKLSQQTKNTALLKEVAKRQLLQTSAPLRAQLMGNLKKVMKERMSADPHMWDCVKSLQASAIDTLWEDLEKEIELNVELAWLHSQEAQTEPERVSTWSCYAFVRKKILHHYLPYDRSIFGKLRDPIYLALTMTMLIPNAGFRVSVLSMILAFILHPGPPDEFQLINFILLCKGTQFLTGGLVSMGQGAAIYFGCFNWHETELSACVAERGPGRVSSLAGELADYLGSIMLVWVAFFCLTFAQERRQRENELKREAYDRQQQEKDGNPDLNAKASTRLKIEVRGGRISSLLKYDVACFIISLFVLLLLNSKTLMGTRGAYEVTAYRHFQEDIFWCKVLYSLFSFPFLIFTIQPLQQVLTHAAPTGFNENGACVPFCLAEPAEPGEP
ncbi:unnamed protein product [Durusdinium trenchii]|uniref:Uncharacterized protein n=2 Tax=Durusdinium trenchii TaxID=1381693 RepID=A0ABP0IX67_9DINO